MTLNASAVTFRELRASDIPWLVAQHDTLYRRDEGFDGSFAELVHGILNDYHATRDPSCERSWIAEAGGVRLGSIFCVRLNQQTAKLRLFLLTPEARGLGLGRRMLDLCQRYARDRGYSGMSLWTHESHRAACALYCGCGWRLVRSVPVQSFGVDLVEQGWEIHF